MDAATSSPPAEDSGFEDDLRVVARADGTFEGRCLPGRSGRIYGGQVLAQAWMAARDRADTTWRPHSVSAHFLRAGVPADVVRYRSAVMHESGHFRTARIDAEQEQGVIASVVVSMHRHRRTTSHQVKPPAVAPGSPSEMPPAGGGPIPDPRAPIRRPFDLRRASLMDSLGSDGRPQFGLWARLRHDLADQSDNDAALMWLTDFALTRVADLEHEDEPGARRAASLHHAMWLHRPTDLAHWHLYVLSSPAYCDGLALSTGQIFRPSGDLVASVSQESALWRA